MPDVSTIAIDCRFASTLSGLGRYTRELVVRLTALPSDVRYIVFVRSKEEAWLKDLRSDVEILAADVPHYSLKEHTALPSLLKRAKADLLFSPHFNIPFFCPVPFVVTIHDLILHRFPNDASLLKQAAYKILMARAVKKAKRIIAISDFAKAELDDAYGKRIAKKVTVIKEGVSDLYRPASEHEQSLIREQYQLTRPYILYVGNAKQHKNVALLLKAFERAGETGHDLVLVTGGKEADALTLPPHVRRLENVSDTDLPALYSAADAFFTATLYEGFCLPVAEALACGCPVVATDLPVLREIARDHAVFLEPALDAFTNAFKNIPVRRNTCRIGDWKQTALETEALLRTIIKQ